jgi:predicted ATPase
VLELRKVLGDDAGRPRFIQTLPKRGYRFVAQVTERTSTAPHASTGNAAQEETKAAAIVGREDELGRLNTQLRLLVNGQRQVVFVTGEAGIGKTALVDAFCRQLEPSTVRVARGQCVQGVGGKEEYYPVTEALCQLCSSPDGEAACRVLERMAPAWLASGRDHRAHGAGASSTSRPAAQERTLGDLCGALEELAMEKPLILVFEDLHWADDSTLHLISALARRRAQAKLIVIATYCPRTGAVRLGEDPLKGLKADLLMRRLCVEMPLHPLKKAEARLLISRELGQEVLPPGLADFVYPRSEGNPLFVIAILEHIVAQGILVRTVPNGPGQTDPTDRWEQRAPFPELEAGFPEQLARMVELEIERLSEDEQRMLEAASLIIVAFPAWAVAAALGMDPVEIEEACDGLARRLHFVVRAGQDELPDGTKSAFYAFAHGLYREVLYQRQAASRRARRHIRIAERLGELFAGREVNVAREIAMHYEAAGELERATSVLESAARQAQQASIC